MKISNRKLVCAGVCFIAASVFVGLGKADFAGWADFVKWVFGIYAAGNVGDHASNAIGSK